MSGSVGTALLLTSLGALGTAIGGLAVVIQPKMSFKRLGYLQGLAGGLMLSISMFDLFPSSVKSIGFAAANVWFFVGVLFFAAIIALVPEPSPESLAVDLSDIPGIEPQPSTSPKLRDASTAGDKSSSESSGVNKSSSGSLGNLSATNPVKRNTGKKSSPVVKSPASTDASDTTGATGSLAPQASAPAAADGGAVASVSAECSITTDVARTLAIKRQRVLMSGLITALGIALHNFPEGVAVFLASVKSHAVGASLAFAIALHNVPEGVAVALPVFFASGSRLKGFKYAFLSGLAEPLAVVVLALFFPENVDRQIVDALLAAVGGVMAFLALHELLPLSIEHAGRRGAVLCLFAGMAIMSFNLYLLDHWFGHEHGH